MDEERTVEELVTAYQQLTGHLAMLAPKDDNLQEVWNRFWRAAQPVAPTASVLNVPSAIADFVGRDGVLDELASRLAASGSAVLVGLAGTGKTAVAVEYAQRHQPEFDVAWWCQATTPASVEEAFKGLAASLDLPPGDRDAVRVWLERNERWLLVLDEVPSPEIVEPYLPRVRKGQLLITSRSTSWGSATATIAVGPLDTQDAVELLSRRSGAREAASAST